MDQNTYNKKVILGLNPFDDELATVEITISNKYKIKHRIPLYPIYKSNIRFSDVLRNIIDAHEKELDNIKVIQVVDEEDV